MTEPDFPGPEGVDICQSIFHPIPPNEADIQAAIDEGAVNAKRAERFLRPYRRT